MKTFLETFGDDLGENTPAMNVIKIGLNIDEEFWNNFIKITNNSTALGYLLDISPEKIKTWGNKIKENLKKVKKFNEKFGKKKTKMIHTDT